MIHVAYRLWGGDGFFAKMLGTSMLSMFENTKEKVTIHIMHNDRLTPDNRGKLCYIAGQYNQRVEFHNVEEIAGESLRKFEEAHPILSGINAAWYPCIVHEVFQNLDKLIFFSADTIINLDIDELWVYDLNKIGFGLAAVPEIFSKVPNFHELTVDGVVKYEDYFNTDVLMFNPSFFRKNFELILDGCKFIFNSKRYTQNEQDVFSYLFSKKYFKLPGKFNLHVNYIRRIKESPHLEKAIYHFAGGNVTKPSLNTDDIYDRLYLEYFLKTPWANVDMFGNIDKFFNRFYNESKNTLLHFTNLLAERERAFFVEGNNQEAVSNIFAVQDKELVLDASAPDGGEKLLSALNESRGKKIFFILTSNYFAIRIALLQRGFVEGEDFVNGIMFLSEQHGVKTNFDSRAIVREM